MMQIAKFKIPKEVFSFRIPSLCWEGQKNEKLILTLERILHLKCKGWEGYEKTVIYTPRTRLFLSPVKLRTPTKMKYHQCPEFCQVYLIQFYYSGWNELTEGLQSRLRSLTSPLSAVIGKDTIFMFYTGGFFKCAVSW